MTRLTPIIEIIEQHELRRDEDTTSTFVTAQLLSADDWFTPLVIRRLQLAHAARAEQFCAALERWQSVHTSRVGLVFDVVRDGDPFAIQNHPGEHTLAQLAHVPLAPRLSEQILATIVDGLAMIHAAGLAHGDVRAGSVALSASSGDVQLMVGRPWCERASQADDLRRTAALCNQLLVDRRGAATVAELVRAGQPRAG